VINVITHPAKQAGHHVDISSAYRITQAVFAIVAMILLDRRTTCPPPPSTLTRLRICKVSSACSAPPPLCHVLRLPRSVYATHPSRLSIQSIYLAIAGNEMRRANGSSVTRLS